MSIDFTFQAEDANVVYSVLNGLMLGGLLTTMGFSFSTSKIGFRVTILIIVILFSVLGAGYIGIEITIPLLEYPTWASNTPDGLYFVVANWYVFAALVIVSFATEAETTVTEIGWNKIF